VRHTKRGGASSLPGRRGGTAGRTRHQEEIAERNLREAAQAAAEFFQTGRARRILLGGHPTTTARFRELLPKTWQSLIIGEFPIDMDAGPEILQRAMTIAEQAEVRKPAWTRWRRRRDSVIRLGGTARRPRRARADLFVRDGFTCPGFQCTGCDA
jgi:hypothetical protein